MRAHPDATSDLRESIEQVLDDPWKQSKKSKERPIAHYNALMATQRSESRLFGDSSC